MTTVPLHPGLQDSSTVPLTEKSFQSITVVRALSYVG